MERAAGREGGAVETAMPAGIVAGIPADVLAFAQRVLDAGRRALASPACPPRVLQRAIAIPIDATSRGSWAERVWAVVFDSREAAAPAMLSSASARLLRWTGEGGSLDVELSESPDGGVVLKGTADAEGDLVVEVAAEAGRRVRAPV